MATKKNKSSTGAKERHVAAKRRKLRAHAEAQIEEYLRGVGFEKPSELKQAGRYDLDTGNAQGFATVQNLGGELTYLVAVRIMALPSDQELVVPLLRELVELNAEIMGPARVAIEGDAVFAGVQDVVELMPDPDFGRYIDATLGVAEDAMKRLSRKYGETTRKRKR